MVECHLPWSRQGWPALTRSVFAPSSGQPSKAWLATDPFDNPDAPPGPLYMPEYRDSLNARADQLEAEAAAIFEEGKNAYQQSTAYLLTTVFLATVLLFITISQRFEWTPIKVVVLSIAGLMLLLGLYRLITFPVY